MGARVGEELGLGVGSRVGGLVGARDGATVGRLVGGLVGEEEGVRVGAVGACQGKTKWEGAMCVSRRLARSLVQRTHGS